MTDTDIDPNRRRALKTIAGGATAAAFFKGSEKITGFDPVVGTAKAVHPLTLAVGVKGFAYVGTTVTGYRHGVPPDFDKDGGDPEELLEEAKEDDTRENMNSLANLWDKAERHFAETLNLDDEDDTVEFSAMSNSIWRKARIETVKAYYDGDSIPEAQNRVDDHVDSDYVRGHMDVVNFWDGWMIESLNLWTNLIDLEMDDIQLVHTHSDESEETYLPSAEGANYLANEYQELEVIGQDSDVMDKSPLVRMEWGGYLPKHPEDIEEYDEGASVLVGVVFEQSGEYKLVTPVAFDGDYANAHPFEPPDIDEALGIGHDEELEIRNQTDDILLYDMGRIQEIIHQQGIAHSDGIDQTDVFVENVYEHLDEEGFGPDTILGPQDLIQGWGYAPEYSRAEVEMLMVQMELPEERGVRFHLSEYDSDGNLVREQFDALLFVDPTDEQLSVSPGDELQRGVDYDYAQIGVPGAGNQLTDTELGMRQNSGGSIQIHDIDGEDEVTFREWNEPQYDPTTEEDIERAVDDAEENQELWNEVWDAFDQGLVGWFQQQVEDNFVALVGLLLAFWYLMSDRDEDLSEIIGGNNQ